MLDGVFASVWPLAQAALLLTGLLGPGAVMMRALRVPATLATSFAGSVVALYATVLALQLGSWRISLVSLSAGLALTAIIAGCFVRRAGTTGTIAGSPRPPWFGPLTQMGVWTPVYLLFWILVLWRVTHQPLAGADVEFRWSFLAEQMLRLGSLDFYPPQSPEDFRRYFWAESIPPSAAALHAWAYACAGRVAFEWTTPAVVLQLWAIHQLIWSIAEKTGGQRAARFGCLAAMACPLLTWSALLGQETGLTALALIGMLYALHRAANEASAPRWIALAGVFSVLGAAAREYGLVFPVLLATFLVVYRAPRAAWLTFAGFALLALVWPVRTAWLTGNPFYSLPFFGLPTNPRFAAWIEHDGTAALADLYTPSAWRGIIRYFFWYAPIAVIGWLVLAIAAVRRQRDAAFALAAATIVLALWFTSIRYTNGGIFYSMRVTSPAIAVGAVAAAIAFAARAHAKGRGMGAAIMGCFIAFTLPATLSLPANPLRVPRADWPLFAPPVELTTGMDDPTVALARNSRAGSAVIADAPGLQRRFLAVGIDVIPLWSPETDWLFDRTLPRSEAQRLWRKSGATHVILSRWGVNIQFFEALASTAHPDAHFRLQLAGQTPLYAVFTLQPVE